LSSLSIKPIIKACSPAGKQPVITSKYMLKKIMMLAVVPQENKYTAYFHCKEENIILPLEISSEASFALLSAQQKLLFDCSRNFAVDPNLKIDLKVELFVDDWLLKNCGIRITKKLLEKSLS